VIDSHDVERVAAAAAELPPAGASYLEEDFVSNLFLAVLDYMLTTAVVERALAHFRANRWEDVRSLDELEVLVSRYVDDQDGNTALAQHLWGYKLWTRAEQLRRLAEFFRGIGVVDQASLRNWAHGSEFRRDFEGQVKGLGRAVYQALVMRLGVDTVKPDVHVRRFAEAALSRRLSDDDVVDVVARAARELGIRARELDWRIWAAGRHR
jgi:hypothetical protein